MKTSETLWRSRLERAVSVRETCARHPSRARAAFYTSFQNSARSAVVTHAVKAKTLDFSTHALPRSL